VVKERLRWIKAMLLESGNNTWKPDAGYEARVLCGAFYYSSASCALTLVDPVTFTLTKFFDSAIATAGWYPINPIDIETACLDRSQMASSKDVWFSSKQFLQASGGAGYKARLLVEVVKVDPITGEHLA